MNEQPDQAKSLGAKLLRCEDSANEDPVNETSDYKEYRMNLEVTLDRAERNEKTAFHICWTSLIVSITLMFVGGSGIVGSFDPWEDTSTPLSMALSVIYGIAIIAFPLSAASLYSRFRPRIKQTKDAILHANVSDLKREVAELREQLAKRDER